MVLLKNYLTFRFRQASRFFLFVDENAVTVASTFTIEATRTTTESEPNDTPATADPIPFGVEGTISPAGEADFFGLSTPVVGARLFAMVDGVAGHSNTDFDLRVTTTTDTLEYDDANNDIPFGASSGNVAGTPLTVVPTFMRVSYFAAGTAAEPYRLYSAVQPPGGGLGGSSATAESEPNDTTPQADSAVNNFFSGALAPGDIDLFTFNANVGDIIFLSLDTDPLRNNTPINSALALNDSSGAVLVAVNDGGTTSNTTSGAGSLTAITPNSLAESLVWRARYTGVYFARATSVGTGDYLLSVSRSGQIGTPTASGSLVHGRVVDQNGLPLAGAVMNLTAHRIARRSPTPTATIVSRTWKRMASTP